MHSCSLTNEGQLDPVKDTHALTCLSNNTPHQMRGRKEYIKHLSPSLGVPGIYCYSYRESSPFPAQDILWAPAYGQFTGHTLFRGCTSQSSQKSLRVRTTERVFEFLLRALPSMRQEIGAGCVCEQPFTSSSHSLN